MLYRVYVEKKQELAHEAQRLLKEARSFLGIKGLEQLRIVNRYDVENISKELFDTAVQQVFSEPQVDHVCFELDAEGCHCFGVEYIPGQFDQRADSAEQCIQLLSCGDRPVVKTAKIYLLKGELTKESVDKLKQYVINPVESREASLALPETLQESYPAPAPVTILQGFRDQQDGELEILLNELGLAMDIDDLRLCRDYFQEEGRDPSLTEIRILDTYWSDHCRHTTFLTTLDSICFEDEALQQSYRRYLSLRKELGRSKPINLMDMGTIAARCLKARGLLDKLDESDEINACTVKIKVNTDKGQEDWLLLFKNETHNHPTEIEPFGGAATCIGGAIRDPLSGRAYVYGAMRITGAADPLRAVEETLPGKLPQKKIVATAASGYSSYGNQIGLATGMVDEIYHPGYGAKHMEIGAVIGAVPQAYVRRETPAPGDAVILLGGKTGRDGCGGATGSSKAHNVESLSSCGAEVQKGNAPEERKLQRLFRNPEATKCIKRCNDFGAGGVSVAIGELAEGLQIDLNAVPKKYLGLDGTELAISESQERMAVVVEKAQAEYFIRLAEKENLQATVVATVTAEPRLRMEWNGQRVADIARAFLDSNGAQKHITAVVKPARMLSKALPESFTRGLTELAGDINLCSRKGLAQRFDSTIGAGTVLMPFGGKHQLTPIQAMVHKVSAENAFVHTCSAMSWGYDPFISEQSPYHGAYLAVVESVCKLIATGATFRDVYLTFQEYFEKLRKEPDRWGKPVAALLGALDAQMELGVAAIGGKDSMSGSFEGLDVPPTLVSFAVTTMEEDEVISPEFKKAGSRVYLLRPAYNEKGLPTAESLKALFDRIQALHRQGKLLSCYTIGQGGVAEAVLKMCLGNGFGFSFEDVSIETLFAYGYGSFLVETEEPTEGLFIGRVTEEESFCYGEERLALHALQQRYESTLDSVYPRLVPTSAGTVPMGKNGRSVCTAPHIKTVKPKVVIPVFPGTNCEYDVAKQFAAAGGEAGITVINNLNSQGIQRSVEAFAKAIQQAEILFLPGGFSGGDEPEGSAKFIAAFLRNPEIKAAIEQLMEKRGGLIGGICNGFQALIKLGLLPYGRITEPDAHAPTLTFNTVGSHQSMLVRTRIASNMSPWLKHTKAGDIFTVPISHGEGRFYAEEACLQALNEGGQIATQYVDLNGQPTMDIRYNPNGSLYAIEGITSPDGRIFGKMGHTERIGDGLYQNVPGRFDRELFASAVAFFC